MNYTRRHTRILIMNFLRGHGELHVELRGELHGDLDYDRDLQTEYRRLTRLHLLSACWFDVFRFCVWSHRNGCH